MMRRYRIVEPGENWEPIDIIMTEEEIMLTCFEYWANIMHRIGKADKITYEDCLQDWVIVNWAEEL